jgi:hypothetical protein
MIKLENFVWLGFIAAIAGIFYLSGDGFYRYPCMDPQNWAAVECTPPICTRTRMCATDLTGASQ